MATISFKEELTVTNKEKITEIAKALKKPRDTSVRPAQPPKMTADTRALWFKR